MQTYGQTLYFPGRTYGQTLSVFVLDVSAAAVASGMLSQCVATIKECLDELSGQPRTQVGFVCFDSGVHFFNLKQGLSQPQILTVPDLAELSLPLPGDLLVNLADYVEVSGGMADDTKNTVEKQRDVLKHCFVCSRVVFLCGDWESNKKKSFAPTLKRSSRTSKAPERHGKRAVLEDSSGTW